MKKESVLFEFMPYFIDWNKINSARKRIVSVAGGALILACGNPSETLHVSNYLFIQKTKQQKNINNKINNKINYVNNKWILWKKYRSY